MFELSVMIVNNTGLAVSPGGGALISSSNLTFATTAPGPQELDIRLEITDGPNYGKIQRLRSNGKWVTTRRFSQRQIEKEKIRYIHRWGLALIRNILNCSQLTLLPFMNLLNDLC